MTAPRALTVLDILTMVEIEPILPANSHVMA